MIGVQILPLKMMKEPLLLISRVLVQMDISQANRETIGSIISILVTSSSNYCSYINELMIVVLGLREKLIEIFVKDISYPLSLAVVRLIGELCYVSVEEACIFLKLQLLPTLKERLDYFNSLKTQGKDHDVLRAEICWCLSNLKQSKINVTELALHLNLFSTLKATYNLSASLRTKFEVIYLISFYLKGR